MEFRILGPVGVADGGRDLTPPRPKQRALLVLLLLRAGELVTADEAAEALWDGRPPPTARNAVQGHVAALRKLLGRDRVETRDGSYVLHVGEDELDLHRFERLVTDARGRPPETRMQLLEEALLLFRGEPLEDLRYEAFASAEAARIEELRLLAIEALGDAKLELGRHQELVPELERLARESPLRERLHAQLVLALYRCGRQADALAAYRRARDTLVEEVGIDPGPELRRLERQVLTQDPALDFRPASDRVRLPSPPTPLLGRREDVAAVSALLLEGRRVVTLVGPGGIGKTRLALEAARQVAHRFAGGAVFVSLAPLADPDLVLPSLAHALGAGERGRPLAEALPAAVGDRPTLAVLDNVEHLPAAVPALGRLVADAPALTLLATSREPLRLYGEHLFRVPPLDEEAAVALFAERASAVGWRGGAEAVVAEICRRLDRLPLAIELAAARMDVLAPSALLDRLDAPLEVLADGPVDQPERLQALRRTLAWSYERLAPAEQEVFRALSVFAGSWTVEAAGDVCGRGRDVVRALSSLLDKSLLQPLETGPEPRQGMLETVREYARELLAEHGEDASTRALHRRHFLALAETAEPHLRGTPGEWLDRLEREQPNLRAAFDAAPAPEALRLAGALWRFWYLRGHLTEGRRRLEAVLADAPPGPPRAKALVGAAVMAANTGDPDTARARAAEARMLAEELGDAWTAAYAAFMLGNVEPDAAAARRDYEGAIVSFRALGDEHSALLASRHLALLLGETGHVGEALELHRQNLVGARATGNGRLAASTLGALAEAELAAGRPAAAAELLRESLELHRQLGDVLDTAVDVCRFAASVAAEEPELAATLLGAFDALGDPADGRRSWVAALNEATVASARMRLGAEAFDAAWARGRELTLDEAVALAVVR